MEYYCDKLNFKFQVPNNDFKPITDEGKVKIFNMDEDQLKLNLFIFFELKNSRPTGRYFQIVADPGTYSNKEELEKGQDLSRDNIKKFFPELEQISELDLMPQNIRKCVWKRPDGSLMSQYYMGVNNKYMICVSGDISAKNDDLDTLMANICFSVSSPRN